jgi:hypothetical protein
LTPVREQIARLAISNYEILAALCAKPSAQH